MRFGVIHKERLARSRSTIIDAPSFGALSQHRELDFIDPYEGHMVEAVVDFEGRRVIRSGMPGNRDIVAEVDPNLRQPTSDYAFWFRSIRSPYPQTAIVDSDTSAKAMSADGAAAFGGEDPKSVYVDSIIDFKEQMIRPVAMKADGSIIEVWDGDFGERTPGEWFEREAAGLNIEEEEQCQD